jgi:hypothetical protein
LHGDAGFLDAALEELLLRAFDERLDDGEVPAGMDDGDAEGFAVMLLRVRGLGGHG